MLEVISKLGSGLKSKTQANEKVQKEGKENETYN